MKILVTGGAGFIGYHLTKKLLNNGFEILSIDSLNDYYDVNLKKNRIANIESSENANAFKFHKVDLTNKEHCYDIFSKNKFDIVIHLAAQPGVRYSIENPHAYIDSNIQGFMNVIEGCRNFDIKHFIYASSSSVYGLNVSVPFKTTDNTDNPISLYAATKKSNELIAQTYSHLYGIPTTGLRFFTVYGPYGRPDMAYFNFTKSILSGNPIDAYGYGELKRDFTYVDDITEGLLRLIDKPPTRQQNELSNISSFHKIFNIGNNSPVTVNEFIRTIEIACGKKAIVNRKPMPLGDVTETYADIDDLFEHTGFKPITSLEVGITNFVKWYKEYALK